MLLSPPSQIVRQAPEDDPYNTELLFPIEQPIDILIEFPDGHPREITRVALFVDDEMVTEITSPPFNQFKWDISEYLSSGEHSLQIEVEDSLGLTKMSLGVPLTLTLVQPPTGMLAFFGRNSFALTIGVVTLAGLFLAAILLVGGRRGIRTFATRRKEKKASFDPVSQPIPALKNEDNQKRRIPLPGWTTRQQRVRASAYLTRLNGNGNSGTGKPIPLTGEKISFGTDPVKVAFVLDHPTISPLHAQLSQNEAGGFIVSDKESVAGTWVNFEEVDQIGKELAHGDVIHFGMLRYQFTTAKPLKKQKAEIVVEKAVS